MATQDRLPTGDGTTTAWTPSSGSDHYAMVDDPIGTPDDDTTYLETSSTNQKELFTFTAFDINSSSIDKVTVFIRARDTGANTNMIAELLRVNGTDYNASPVPAPLTYTNHTNDWLTNPDTAAAWTEADVEGTGSNPIQQFGVGSGIVTDALRCTQVYCTVTYTEATGIEVLRRRIEGY